MSIESGSTVLHYRIVEKLGEGGMGVVWKAVDTTLDREVAIKILPDLFADDADRLARFEREAKLLASLNHPNIASVYGLHQAGQQRFLAMELVGGEDLSDRLSRGPLPIDDALELGRQVAEALEAAHESGVIHRDLKPANIKLGPEGRIKVLDFGLAKAFEPDPASGASPTMSPTLTSAGTRAGMILGTAAYMSPEQARGYVVDKRADIWAFGAVLYEMLTGKHAFAGETVSDTLASVLKVEPDWDALQEDTPDSVRRLLGRCLEKDPKQRLRDIGEARIGAAEASMTPGERVAERAPATVETRRSRPWLAGVLALVGLAAGGAVGWALRPTPAEPPTRRFLVTGADATADVDTPEISPDGKRIAYIQDDRLFVRDIDQFLSSAVDGTQGASNPFWSPDSTTVAYFATGKLWKVPASGGRPTRICDLEGIEGGSWSDDGTLVLVRERSLQQVSSRGGDVQTIFEGDRKSVVDYHDVDHLPGGRGYLVAVHASDSSVRLELWVGERHDVLLQFEDAMISSLHYASSGFILYSRFLSNEGIWALPFSIATLAATGDPFLVAPQGAHPSVSNDGTLIYVVGGDASEDQLAWVGLNGEVGGTAGQPQSNIWVPTLSPDGTKVIVSGEENNEFDLWIHDASRGTKTRLTFTEGIEGSGPWSPDGKQVFFYHPVFSDERKIYSVPADGRGDPVFLVDGADLTISGDGESMAFVRQGEETGRDLWMMPLDGSEEPEVFLKTAAAEWRPMLSPDGRLLAYQSDESGRGEIYIKPFPSGEGKWQVSIEGGVWPRWNRTGDLLYFVRDNQLLEVSIEGGAGLRLSSPRVVIDGASNRLRLGRAFSVAPEGNRIIAVQRVKNEDEEAPPLGIFVVENWIAEFDE